MKFVFFGCLFVYLITGCTLSKEELSQTSIDKTTIDIGYLKIDSSQMTDYIIILLADTAEIFHQTTLFTGTNNKIRISPDSIPSKFWIVLKKWSPHYDSVYESKPIFISFQVPEKTTIINLTLPDIQITKRQSVYKLEQVSLTLNGNYSNWNSYNWDPSKFDDAVSGSLPDFYFTLNDFFATGLTDYIDQPLGLFQYTFHNMTISPTLPKIKLTGNDYDFNVTNDDLMFVYNFSIYPFKNNIAFKSYGLIKLLTIDSDETSPLATLSLKIY